MKQVVIIHGGNSFASYADYIKYMQQKELEYSRLLYQPSWKHWIAEQLDSHDVLLPTFPNASNAQFTEWANYFEKILPFLKNDVQLVGHSLGAMFLAKYLQHHPLDKSIKRLILIAGRYSDSTYDAGSFNIVDTSQLNKSAREVHLFHSEDDVVVPFADVHKFHADLPNASLHSFKDYGHFNSPTFPELLALLKQK